jgi:hypothetical protein
MLNNIDRIMLLLLKKRYLNVKERKKERNLTTISNSINRKYQQYKYLHLDEEQYLLDKIIDEFHFLEHFLLQQ